MKIDGLYANIFCALSIGRVRKQFTLDKKEKPKHYIICGKVGWMAK